jgi:FkbM family methyltransferase
MRLDGKMGNLVKVSGFWVPAHYPDQSFVIINDIYQNNAYRTNLHPISYDVEYVVDLGANIGCFSKLWHERNSKAKIVAVEVCSELIPALRENVGKFAEIEHAACHYSNERLYLLNSFSDKGLSTGGSRVVERAEFDTETHSQYKKEDSFMQKITLEEIQQKYNFPHIDVLKLDIEGSEYSVLENCDLSRVKAIFIESHGEDRFQNLLEKKFSGWGIYRTSKHGEFSNWYLVQQ